MDFPSFDFGITRIHPEEIAGEDCGFVATGTGPDFKHRVAVFIRIGRQESEGEGLFCVWESGLGLCEFQLCEFDQFRISVRISDHLPIVFDGIERPVVDGGAFLEFTQIRVFADEFPVGSLVGGGFRQGQQVFDFAEAEQDFLDILFRDHGAKR